MVQKIDNLKLFVSSPSDVDNERKSILKLANELNDIWGEFLNRKFSVLMWEKDVHSDIGDEPQEVISEQIGKNYDIFIGILWTRFGTKTKKASSGTEHEFLEAYERYMQNPEKLKILFFFRVNSPKDLKSINPDQLSKVNEFKESLSKYGVLYLEYKNLTNFEAIVRMSLSKLFQEWGVKWGEIQADSKQMDLDKVAEKIQKLEEVYFNRSEDEEENGKNIIGGIIEYHIENANTHLSESMFKLNNLTQTLSEGADEVIKLDSNIRKLPDSPKKRTIYSVRVSTQLNKFSNKLSTLTIDFSDSLSAGLSEYSKGFSIIKLINDIIPIIDFNEIINLIDELILVIERTNNSLVEIDEILLNFPSYSNSLKKSSAKLRNRMTIIRLEHEYSIQIVRVFKEGLINLFSK